MLKRASAALSALAIAVLANIAHAKGGGTSLSYPSYAGNEAGFTLIGLVLVVAAIADLVWLVETLGNMVWKMFR